jgi:hypothetical protein
VAEPSQTAGIEWQLRVAAAAREARVNAGNVSDLRVRPALTAVEAVNAGRRAISVGRPAFTRASAEAPPRAGPSSMPQLT